MIILTLYAVLVWLIFFRCRWLDWNRASQALVAVIGLGICLVVIAQLNVRAPAGRVAVIGVVVEIAPAVGGVVSAVHVVPNAPVAAGTPLFQLDPRPFPFAVDDTVAALDIATRTLERQQAAFERSEGAAVTRQALDERQAAFDAARARLANAEYELKQSTVRAPADGIVTATSLSPGDQARPFAPVMPFIETDSLRLAGVFGHNGLGAIRRGARVEMAFDSAPGRLFTSEIREILPGVAGGQIDVGADLLTAADGCGASEVVVLLAWPDALPEDTARLGMVGTATVFGENAAPFGMLAKVLLWGRMLGTCL